MLVLALETIVPKTVCRVYVKHPWTEYPAPHLLATCWISAKVWAASPFHLLQLSFLCLMTCLTYSWAWGMSPCRWSSLQLRHLQGGSYTYIYCSGSRWPTERNGMFLLRKHAWNSSGKCASGLWAQWPHRELAFCKVVLRRNKTTECCRKVPRYFGPDLNRGSMEGRRWPWSLCLYNETVSTNDS